MTDKEKLDAIKAEIHRLVDVRGYDREMANDLFAFMNSLPNEPVSEGLEQAAHQYYEPNDKFMEGFKKGAKWKEEQFEKNRLAACDKQTEKEAEIERDFVTSIIEKEHRQPTFDDAIKCGMMLKEEEIKEALLSEVLPCFMHGGEADEVVAKLDEVLNQKK